MAFTGIGTGAVVVFATTAFLADLRDINGPGLTRESFNVSHHGSVIWHEFIPGALVDGGEITLEIGFDGDELSSILDVKESITITWRKKIPASGSGAIWTFTGFVTGYEPQAPLEGVSIATVTIKVDGAIVVTDEV